MTLDSTSERSTGAAAQWGVIVAILLSILGVPAALLAEFEFGALSALGLSGDLALGLFAMIPGFLLGLVACVVMLGS